MKINTMLQCTEEAESYRILLSHITQVRRCTAVKTNQRVFCCALSRTSQWDWDVAHCEVLETAQHVYYNNKSCSGDSVVRSARG